MNANFYSGLNLVGTVADLSGGTYFSTGGPGGQAGEGYSLLPTASSPYIFTHPPISSGKVTYRFWYRDLSTQFGNANFNWSVFAIDASGSLVSASARAAIIFTRQNAASAAVLPVQYRDNDSFPYLQLGEGRGLWRQIEIVVDIDNDRYDVYVQGRREVVAAVSKMTTGSLSRLAFVAANAAGFSMQFAGVEVFTGDRDVLTPVIEQGFITPSTAIADLLVNSNEQITLHPQFYQTADNGGLGNWTKATDGLAPGTGVSMLLADTGPSGRWDWTFNTGASGNNYLGVMFNAYEGVGTSLGTEDACFIFRYANASASDVALFRGSTTLASNPTASGVTIGASETHTLSIVHLEGSPLIYCYIDGSIQFGGPVTLDNTNQLRGLDGETWAGIYHDAALGSGNDRCVAFKFSETPQPWREVINTGQLTAVLKPTCVRELYLADSGSNENLYSGKGIQQQHRAAAEGSMDRAARLIATIDTPLVQSRTMRGFAVNGAADQGETESITTIVGNRIHVYERLTSAASNSYTTDNDYRMRGVVANGAASIGNSGAGSTFNPRFNHDWTTRVSAQSLPIGHQVLYEYDNGRAARINAMMINVGAGALSAYSQSKHKGHDPLSITLGVSSVTSGNTAEYAISYLYDSLSSATIDTARLAAIRDDRKTLTGWTAATGSLKTNEAGDVNTDGFDEKFGWWSFTASGGEISIASATARVQPVFRIYSLGDQVVVSVAGSQLDRDEYIVQDLGDGSTIVALLVDVAAAATIGIAQATGGSSSDSLARHSISRHSLARAG